MDGATILGFSALMNIIISLISIVVCWWVLINVKIEAMMRVKKPAQARAFIIVLAIVLGHNLARFVIDYLDWSRLLSQLFT